MSSSLGSSHGGSGSGSLTASGEVHVSLKLKELDNRELKNNELNLYIMQEFTPIFFHLHYLRICPWKYKRDGRGFAYNSFRGSKDDTHGRLVKHDSVIVQYGDREWIKGEKGGVEPQMKVGGIRVSSREDERAPELWEDDGDEGPGRYSVRFETGRINLGEGKVKWTVGNLKKLLTDSDEPRYHVLRANCWKYAYLSAKAVLEWVIENAQDEQVKNQVQEKLDQLERIKRPQPLVLWRALRKASRDRAVLLQYRRKLSDTYAHLPSKSHVRKRACRGIKRIVISRCYTKTSDAGSESDRVLLVRRVMRRPLGFAWHSSAQEKMDELRRSKQEQFVKVSVPSDEGGLPDEDGALDEDEAEPQVRAMARTKMGRWRTIEARSLDRPIKMGMCRRIEVEPVGPRSRLGWTSRIARYLRQPHYISLLR